MLYCVLYYMNVICIYMNIILILYSYLYHFGSYLIFNELRDDFLREKEFDYFIHYFL